jgi:hypothetical protein
VALAIVAGDGQRTREVRRHQPESDGYQGGHQAAGQSTPMLKMTCR